jgi:hypothetical protein
VISFTSWSLYSPGKSPWYPFDRRLSGPQSRSGRGGEEKNSHPLPGLEPPTIQLVVQRFITKLSRLIVNYLVNEHSFIHSPGRLSQTLMCVQFESQPVNARPNSSSRSLQPFQANVGTVPWNRPSSCPFHFLIHNHRLSSFYHGS